MVAQAEDHNFPVPTGDVRSTGGGQSQRRRAGEGVAKGAGGWAMGRWPMKVMRMAGENNRIRSVVSPSVAPRGSHGARDAVLRRARPPVGSGCTKTGWLPW